MSRHTRCASYSGKVNEGLVDVENLDCMQVDDVECIRILSLDAQCEDGEAEFDESDVGHKNDED